MTIPINLVAGQFKYTDHEGNPQAIYFQFNPTTIRRSRTAEFKETEANDRQGTTVGRSTAGKKYTLTVQRWKIDFDLRLDATKPHYTSQDRLSNEARVSAVQQALTKLETLVEPGPVPTENEATYGYQALPDPPPVQFSWGTRTWAGFVTSLSINETQFTPDLVPTRVEATVSMTVITTPAQDATHRTGGTL